MFCGVETILLIKDPGMIPYFLYKNYNYESYLVSYIAENVDDICTREVKGLKLIHIKDNRKKKDTIPVFAWSMIKYILKNARKIDILNLYFLKHSIVYGIIYKIINPKGILYLKLDLNPDHMKKDEKHKFEKLRSWFYKVYFKYIPDLLSVESNAGYEYVQNKFSLSRLKLIQIPNGVDTSVINRNKMHVKSFEEKENLIITVGRIGTAEKHTEFLLEAARSIRWKDDWKLVCVGPIEEDFQSYIEIFYIENPHLKDRITFTGPIFNKEELFGWYNQAKIFCLSSRYESFGLVFPEAQTFGNYILSTPVAPLNDFIENNTLGRAIKTPTELSLEINQLIENEDILRELYPKIIEHSKPFQWKLIVEKLQRKLENIH